MYREGAEVLLRQAESESGNPRKDPTHDLGRVMIQPQHHRTDYQERHMVLMRERPDELMLTGSV
jgi:hypothetical protein